VEKLTDVKNGSLIFLSVIVSLGLLRKPGQPLTCSALCVTLASYLTPTSCAAAASCMTSASFVTNMQLSRSAIWRTGDCGGVSTASISSHAICATSERLKAFLVGSLRFLVRPQRHFDRESAVSAIFSPAATPFDRESAVFATFSPIVKVVSSIRNVPAMTPLCGPFWYSRLNRKC
jgi:hypothetical protein